MLALGERTRAKAAVVGVAPRPYNVGIHSISSARGDEGFTLTPLSPATVALFVFYRYDVRHLRRW